MLNNHCFVICDALHNTGEYVNAITRGRKNMPAFGKKLTKAQISSLASYVQRFKQ
jgi:mono/diheme cytochrome c family protein